MDTKKWITLVGMVIALAMLIWGGIKPVSFQPTLNVNKTLNSEPVDTQYVYCYDTIIQIKYVDRKVVIKPKEEVVYKFHDSTIVFIDTVYYSVSDSGYHFIQDNGDTLLWAEAPVDTSAFVLYNTYSDYEANEDYNFYWSIETTGTLIGFNPVISVKHPRPRLIDVIKGWFKKKQK